MKKTITLFLFLTPAFLMAQLTTNEKTQLDEYINGLIQPGDPGGAVGVVKDGEIVYERYFGMASLEYQVPITESSIFNIASVAKQFTALCVLKLALESELSLEEDFRKYVPDFLTNVKDTIKIRHLLNHTSGIRDIYDLLGVQGDIWWKKMGFGNQKAVDFLRKQKDLNFQPGSQKIYSNSNYLLLAAIVEKVSGTSFHEYSEELFQSFGMNSTHFIKRYMNVIPNQAMPYSDWGNGIWQKYPLVTKLYGDGFLYTSLSDQLTFEKQIQTQSSELLTVSQKAIENSEITNYGFGLELSDRLGRDAVHHSGLTGSYHAQTVRFPEEKLSIFVMSNNNRLWSGTMADAVAGILLPKEERMAKRAPFDFSKYANEVDMSELEAEYRGSSGKVIRIFTKDNRLFWRQDNNNPIELVKIEGALYHAAYDKEVKIGFDSEGFNVFVNGSEPNFYELLTPFQPTKNYLNDLVGTYYNEEIDVQFRVYFDENSQLKFIQKGDEWAVDFEVIQKDEFLAQDYIFKPVRDENHFIGELFLTYARLKNVRFKKINAETSRLVRYTADGGIIQVGRTQESVGRGKGDILLTKNDTEGNEEWYQLIGGKGYDRPHQIELARDGGYLILGSTSSKGEGNYDAWLIKTNDKGEIEWETTFGDESNNYGYSMKEKMDGTITVKVTDKIPSEDAWKERIYTYKPK